MQAKNYLDISMLIFMLGATTYAAYKTAEGINRDKTEDYNWNMDLWIRRNPIKEIPAKEQLDIVFANTKKF